MKEIWKDIKGYEGLYQVSNLGRVKSLDKIVKSANQYEASRETKIDQGSINRCCNKKQKTAGGYIWRYKED